MSDTKNDLLNILFLARCLGSADGTFDDKEKEFFKKLTHAFNLSPDDIKSFDHHKPIKQAVVELESVEAKKLLVDVLMVLASADGDFDDKEQLFIKKIMKTINLNPSDYPVFRYGEQEVRKIFDNLDDFMEKLKEQALSLNS